MTYRWQCAAKCRKTTYLWAAEVALARWQLWHEIASSLRYHAGLVSPTSYTDRSCRQIWASWTHSWCLVRQSEFTTTTSENALQNQWQIYASQHCILLLTPSLPLRLFTTPYWSNPPVLIFDIRVLWCSVLSARAPECRKSKLVG